jgi:organic radical activating enzyme
VTEIFSSLQGEGVHVGARQIFVRFKECNMDCSYCDTPNRIPAKEYSAKELLSEIEALEKKDGPHHSVSLTGGEPLMYAEFLKEFLPLLKKKGFRAYLETNGTMPGELKQVIGLVDIVAMDLKLPSSTKGAAYWKEHTGFLKIACAKEVFVKAVVTADTEEGDIRRAVALVKSVDAGIPLIIQPATKVRRSDKAVGKERLDHFFEMVSAGGIKDACVIPQMHKILGIR